MKRSETIFGLVRSSRKLENRPTAVVELHTAGVLLPAPDHLFFFFAPALGQDVGATTIVEISKTETRKMTTSKAYPRSLCFPAVCVRAALMRMAVPPAPQGLPYPAPGGNLFVFEIRVAN